MTLNIPKATKPPRVDLDSAESEGRVRAALLRKAYTRKQFDVVATIAVAAVFGPLVYFVLFEHALVWIWMGLLLVINFAALFELRSFALVSERLDLSAQPTVMQRWERIFAVQTTLGGLAWGIPIGLIWPLLPPAQPAAVAILMIALFAVAAVAVASLSEQLLGLRAFLISMLLPAGALIGLSGGAGDKLVALGVFAGLAALWMVANGLHSLVRNLLVQENRLQGAVMAAIDASEEAVAALRVRSQFLANMSHEIRTPMNGVLGMLQLLRRTSLSGQQQDYVGKGDAAARGLLRLLDDFLDMSKIDAGKLQLEHRAFDLHALINDVLSILQGNLHDRPLALKVVMGNGVPRGVEGDSLRIQQVLLNLGSNAIKFTEAGQVQLRIELLDTITEEHIDLVKLRFEVTDTGIGIHPNDQSRIFEGFSQAESSTTRRYGGTGLGLAISQNLVNMMGARIALKSVVGQGSEFSFDLLLPVAAMDFESTQGFVFGSPQGLMEEEEASMTGAQPMHLGAPKGERLRGLRLLLAEDNFINQQIARELLRSEGAQVVLVNNGLEAVQAVQASLLATTHGFDAILMDLQMPEMDGFEATRRILHLQKQHTSHTPILAMSANVADHDKAQTAQAGMVEHLGKPFKLDDLVAAIHKHSLLK